MDKIETIIDGAWILKPTSFEDERGTFTRLYCEENFRILGLEHHYPQINLSCNPHKGTLRGLHMQLGKSAEVKVVRALSGTVFDVAVDMRVNSPTYMKWFGIRLSAVERNAFYIPAGCAHGFITLENDSNLLYQVSKSYSPGAECGFHWNDPAFAIEWPTKPALVSEKDSAFSFIVNEQVFCL